MLCPRLVGLLLCRFFMPNTHLLELSTLNEFAKRKTFEIPGYLFGRIPTLKNERLHDSKIVYLAAFAIH